MKAFIRSGGARRDKVTARRRAVGFTTTISETLESRYLMAAGILGMNVEIGAYQSFVNWLEVPGNWTTNPGQSNSITLNSSNDPTSDATLLFDDRVNEPWNGPDPNAVAPNLSGTYSLSFNGQATLEVEYPGISTPFSVENQTYNAATNTTTASLVVPSNNTSDFFGIVFANTQATPTSGTDTGFSNAVLIRPGYAANSTQLYTNEFLSALQPYSLLRYLDPENTNNQPFMNGNALATVNASQVDQTGMPWEYLVTLANETNTDMWINIPQGATDDYVTALAGIIKNGGTVDGVTYAGLNANLKIYLEYSNEVWGGIPTNEDYQEQAVQNSASNDPLSTFAGNTDIYDNPDGSTTTDVNTAVGRRYLERTAEIGQIFQNVLGADPTHSRVRPVLGWQEDNTSFFPSTLQWYEQYFGPASSAFYGIGDANYFSPTDDSSVNAAIASLESQEIAYSIPETIAFTTVANYYGLANVSYEGGPALSGDPNTAAGQVALAVSRSPQMEQIVYQHYIDFFEDGGEVANYYSGPFGTLTGENNWPIAELSQYGDPSASPRYQGTVDLENATPVAVTAGIHVSATTPIMFTAATDTAGENFATPATGQQGYWMLNVATSGTYDLSLSSVTTGSTAAQFEVLINDKVVSTAATTPLGSDLNIGKITLPAGLDTLSIQMLSPGIQFQSSYFTLAPLGTFAIGDPGFEDESLASSQYLCDPTASSWNFTGSAGIAAPASGFTAGNPSTPQGSQVAFLQGTGSFTQTVANWTAGTYTLSFDAAQRANYGTSVQNIEVLVNGKAVGTFQPSGTNYLNETTSSFTVGSGSNSITFEALNSAGGDNTILLDDVTVAPVLVATSTPTIGDAGFETEQVGPGEFLYGATASSWTFTGTAGISGNGGGFTDGNPVAPQGAQVAFVQEVGTLSQTIANWAEGNYKLSFEAAQRSDVVSNENFEVLVDGAIVGTFDPSGTSYQTFTTSSFTLASGSHTISFVGLNSAGGDNSVLLDNVTTASTLTPISPISPALPTIGDAGFENQSVGAGQFLYGPTGSSWTFAGTAGLSGNGSAFTAGIPAAPQGSQVAFLQEYGTISQSVANWTAGTYTLSFDAVQRADYGTSVENFEVLIDGAVVATIEPSSTAYQIYSTASFTVGAGSHTISFVGLDSAGGDNTVFLDQIAISATPALPTIDDSGFENQSVGAGQFLYEPTGSSWTFAGTAGLSGNGSDFTAGNPAAPQGSQVAVLQQYGTITQSVADWTAGTYTLSFDVAQRANYGTSVENFEVLIDGVVVGTYQPTSTSYQTFVTSSFTVASGTHTISFVGLDSSGGDNTVLIDDVTLS